MPIAAFSSNLHQLPSHRNNISNADPGGGSGPIGVLTHFRSFAHWLVTEISVGPPGEFALPVTHV